MDRDFEDIYPLSPRQEGMLWHTLDAPGGGADVDQLGCRLIGALDRDAFFAAWQEVIDRHPELRTSFRWEGVERPLQVVHRRARPEWEELDWRNGCGAGAGGSWRARAAALFAEERWRRFDLGRVPLQRLGLARVDGGEHVLLWSRHRIVLDGWSLALVLREVLTLYALEVARRRGDDPARGEGDAVRRLLGQLKTLLAGLAPAPAQRLGDLSLPSAAGGAQLPRRGRDRRDGDPADGPLNARGGSNLPWTAGTYPTGARSRPSNRARASANSPLARPTNS